MPEPTKMRCRACGKTKAIDAFGWSPKKRRPTKTCKACWTNPVSARAIGGTETFQELRLYYTEIRELMTKINESQAESIAEGLPVDRPIASLGDVWVGEMTEEAYRAIVQALIRKAESGDVNAAKLLLEERHRRAGEPTKDSVEASFEELFNIPPLTAGLDSE